MKFFLKIKSLKKKKVYKISKQIESNIFISQQQSSGSPTQWNSINNINNKHIKNNNQSIINT